MAIPVSEGNLIIMVDTNQPIYEDPFLADRARVDAEVAAVKAWRHMPTSTRIGICASIFLGALLSICVVTWLTGELAQLLDVPVGLFAIGWVVAAIASLVLAFKLAVLVWNKRLP